MEKNYIRKDRSVSPETRAKISQALKHRPKTEIHKQHISDSLKTSTGGYWSKIPKKEDQTII